METKPQWRVLPVARGPHSAIHHKRPRPQRQQGDEHQVGHQTTQNHKNYKAVQCMLCDKHDKHEQKSPRSRSSASCWSESDPAGQPRTRSPINGDQRELTTMGMTPALKFCFEQKRLGCGQRWRHMTGATKVPISIVYFLINTKVQFCGSTWNIKEQTNWCPCRGC